MAAEPQTAQGDARRIEDEELDEELGIPKSKAPELLTLRCKDDVTTQVDKKFIRESQLIIDSLQFSDASDNELPLTHVTSATLNNVIKFMKYFENEKKYAKPANFHDFDRLADDHPATVFLAGLSSDDMGDLVNAASYMQTDRLIDYCLLIAIRATHGRTVHEIRAELMLPDNYSEEEEKAFRDRHTVP
uniref:Skp1_POZ domain-containing protein n=1 Tax=Panagrellus redivivus TaxID=6233 RepID=A0A7E4ULC1_PANRE